MRRSLMILILALPAFADPLVPREPFAKAHVSLMVRAQMGERFAVAHPPYAVARPVAAL